MKKFVMKSKRDLGEFEGLKINLKPEVKKGKETVLVGIDGGSTGSRCLIIDALDSNNPKVFEEIYTIPSECTITEDSFEILPQAESMYENMDSWITNLIHAPNDIFKKVRVLRGTKSSDSNLGTSGINSSVQKLQTPEFYINMIESIAYGLINKYKDKLVSEYDIYVGCSLRPDDIIKKKNREEFLNKFIGTFLWTNKDLGVDLKLNIKSAVVQTEPEAAVKGYGVRVDELPEYITLIEGGGSSIGVEILKGGKSVRAAAQTLPYAGSQLMNSVESLYLEDNGGANLSLQNLKMALEKGYFKIGRTQVDMVPYVKQAKDSMAQKIMADIKKRVFDRQDEVTIQQLETVLFSGKLFNGGEFEPLNNDDSFTSYRLSEPLSKEFKKYNPSAEYEVLETNLIPFGNLINVLSEYGGYLTQSDQEQEIEVEEKEAIRIVEE